MDLSVGMRAFARGERAHLAEDYATAHACYLEADERGVAAGGRLIAMMYQCGLGRRVDMTEAVRWWRRSLELDLNYAEVLYNLALSLQQGIGVATDEALALAYFRRSADLGFPEGMTSVANALFFGYGCQSACPEGSDRVVAQGFGQGQRRQRGTRGDGGQGQARRHSCGDLACRQLPSRPQRRSAARPRRVLQVVSAGFLLFIFRWGGILHPNSGPNQNPPLPHHPTPNRTDFPPPPSPKKKKTDCGPSAAQRWVTWVR
mmetsp:Transcript_34430/g.85780  ORF Transcript_34430/g.85780 Transcript_34430/m.85780 type:complete len:260 (-) Transcript_34430:721-1500(-)